MAIYNAVHVLPEALRVLGFSSIASTYTAIGTALLNPAHIITLQNTTNQLLYFSWDGVTDHQMLPSNAQLVLDVSSNLVFNAGAFLVAKGTTLYVRYPSDTAPTSGGVYFSSFYGYSGGN